MKLGGVSLKKIHYTCFLLHTIRPINKVHMKQHFWIVLFGIFGLTSSTFGQIAMNQWRIHFSAYKPIGITSTTSNVYMACGNGIINYDLEDNTINQLTVTNGLSDLDISSISSNTDVATVGYVNGNMDIIEGTKITNVPWIKVAEVSGDKTIHNFYFEDNYIYIASGIGLIVFDNDRKEVKDTYYPYSEPVVYDVTIYRDTIFVATEKGIYFAPKSREYLNDFTNWEKKENLPVTVLNGTFTKIEVFNDYLFYLNDNIAFNADTLYYEKDNVRLNYPTPSNISTLKAQDDRLMISLTSSVVVWDPNFNQIELIFDYATGVPAPKDALFKNGDYWISDANNGLVRGSNSYNTSSIFSNTPASDGSYRMDIQYGKVLIAGGGVTQNLQNIYNQNGVYLFENETWTNYNAKTDEKITSESDWDFVSVAVNQNNTDEFAFSSFSEGGIKIVSTGTDITTVYTYENSILEAQLGVMAIPDMKYDDDGNLWVINKGNEPLKVFTATGEQYSFSLGSPSKEKYPYRLMIDDEGNKWVAVTNVGLIAFNENGTFDDTSDDQLRTLSASEGFGNLPSIFVKGLAQDADGEIWIGTEEGLVILYSRNNLYDGTFGQYDAQPIVFLIDGENERLLGETYITAIAVDGGNRKWIGTASSGVFCFEDNGTEEVYRFTTENSPLLSNNILDIRIDQLSGEVYFATEKGLVSFRSDASLADRDFSNVTVFPNPVRPDFAGPITIMGLGYDSDVKITDVSGNLIYQTVSNGGTVIWDGKTLFGERVQSGVYLVWSGVVAGKGKDVAKILFIN